MSTLSIETCIKALHGAALSRKAAFQTELGVSFAVFLMQGGTERNARQMLTEAYASAGYMCLTPTDADYKTINRRINATADLFNTIKMRTVKKWAGALDENKLIAAMVEGLRPYELFTVADVQRYCMPPETVHAKPATASTTVQPHTAILGGPAVNHTGQDKVIQQFRRAADEVAKGAAHIETAHLALMIPKNTTRDELVEMAQKILELAQKRNPALASA